MDLYGYFSEWVSETKARKFVPQQALNGNFHALSSHGF